MVFDSRRVLRIAIGALLLIAPSAVASSLRLQKGRVDVSVTWRSQYSGATGEGIAIPISDVFGFFAFTDPANPEVFVKVLDFGSTSPLLLFYGGLTDFEYHLTFHNRCTGQDVRLDKAPGTYDGGADNRSMLAGCATGPPVADGDDARTVTLASSDALRRYQEVRDDIARREAGGVAPLATTPTLTLSRGRVEVGLTWKSQYDGSSGVSIATPINDTFGFLSFNDAANPEVFVKVLDFGSTSPLLLFYGGLTDFEYEVTYRNVCTEEKVVVRKPPGSFAGGADNRTMYARCEAPPSPPHLAAVKSVGERFSTILASGASQLESVRAVEAYMATLPEYTVTGVDEATRTAYGVLRNGRVHVVLNNRVLDSPPATFRAEPGVSSLAGAEVPASGYARLLQAFGADRSTQEPVEDIAALLEVPGGYVVRSTAGDARLEVLRNINGDAFFYFNGHSGGYFLTRDRTGPVYFTMESSTRVTDDTDRRADIAADFAAGRLTYVTAGSDITNYGINANFVKAYWYFAPNSIVFLNACSTGQTGPGPGAVVEACMANGAGVIFGWDGLANSGSCFTAARYLVDRVVGANKFMKESPPQRAFPWDLVYQDMVAKGLTRSPVTGANLVPRPRPGGSISLLDPSIRDMHVNEPLGKLFLRGYFGSTRGKVDIGSVMHEDCDWAATGDEIICPISTSGPDSSGDVTVIVKGEAGRERKSNTRQLTQWDFRIHYLWKDPNDQTGQRVEGNGTLSYRADVGGYRTKPAGAETLPTRATWGTKDSSFEITASGTWEVSKDCKYTLSGTGILKTMPTGQELGILSPIKLDTFTHLGTIALMIGVPSGEAIPWKETRSGKDCSGESKFTPLFGLLDGFADFHLNDETGGVPVLANAFSFPINQDFTIPPAKRSTNLFGGTLTVEWTNDVRPISPPKPDAAR